ncbi:MAG: 30S ribosomal protein S15 [Thaumarchaeota archaeon]|nr:30S ribosomal protein S15 [Nitrososphaerota archaeon]
MARLHSRRKGKSQSTRPPSKRPPFRIPYGPEEVEELVVKLAKEGLTPSQIGQRLKDQYAIPLVKPITGKGVVEILKERGLAPSIPEDLQNLLNKAKRLREHLSRHKKDRKNVRALELVEAKIHRLAKYYKRKGVIPKDWEYKTVVAQLK